MIKIEEALFTVSSNRSYDKVQKVLVLGSTSGLELSVTQD